MKPPCKDCPDRQVGCHSSCGAYLAWKEEDTAKKQKTYPVAEAYLHGRVNKAYRDRLRKSR